MLQLVQGAAAAEVKVRSTEDTRGKIEGGGVGEEDMGSEGGERGGKAVTQSGGGGVRDDSRADTG